MTPTTQTELPVAQRYSGVLPPEGPHRLDEDRLAAYLRQHLPHWQGSPVVERFRGGQSNPTYRITVGDRRYVLRKKPPGKLLPSAHAVEREYRVISALADSGVPVPRTYFLCTDETVIGTAFFLMDCIEGRIFWDASLPGLDRQACGAVYAEMNRILASLHRVDPAAAGLGDFGKPGGYFQRQIDRWSRQYRSSETEKVQLMEDLLAWLPQNIPAGDECRIVHADYRIDNLVFHPTESRILAVLDWELSTLGHPLADLGAHCVVWRLQPQYWGLAGTDIEAKGIPTEREYVRTYCRGAGRDGVSQWNFYLAFALFRKAAIAQGIVRRALDGNASSSNPLGIDRVHAYARAASACAESAHTDIPAD